LTQQLRHLADCDRTAFIGHDRIIDAVERCSQRITEAAIKLDETFSDEATYLGADDIRARRRFGDRLRHHDETIDADQLWTYVIDELPPLVEATGCELAAMDASSGTTSPESDVSPEKGGRFRLAIDKVVFHAAALALAGGRDRSPRLRITPEDDRFPRTSPWGGIALGKTPRKPTVEMNSGFRSLAYGKSRITRDGGPSAQNRREGAADGHGYGVDRGKEPGDGSHRRQLRDLALQATDAFVQAVLLSFNSAKAVVDARQRRLQALQDRKRLILIVVGLRLGHPHLLSVRMRADARAGKLGGIELPLTRAQSSPGPPAVDPGSRGRVSTGRHFGMLARAVASSVKRFP